MSYRFSARGRRDLKGIVRYTRDTWGQEQADRYNASLTSAFEHLGAHPELGRRRLNLPMDVRVFVVEHHIVVYRPEDTGIYILRVLHQKMDISMELG